MNEELRIIIRAVTDEARRNMAAVREELEGIQDTSTESGEAVDTAMSSITKGTLAAIGAITALTAAMTALGKSAQEVQKGFDKLNTTFLNAGSTTAQASETYKELFSFLGDHDKAIETAQSLALITNEEEKLAEWSNIAMGAFAEMGDKLPIEGLVEAANETINTGVVTGVLADALNWAKVSEDGFNAALEQTSSLEEREALVRSTLNGLYGNSARLYEMNSQATLRYNESQARLNLTLAQASGYTTPLLTSLNELSATLLTAMAPALQTVAMYLTAFIQLMAEAIQWVGGFFGMFSSSSETATANVKGYQNAMTAYQNSLRKAFGGTNGELDENLKKINAVKKATMGFDELNVVSSGSSASASIGVVGGGSGVKLPTAPNPADYGMGGSAFDFSNFTKGIEEAKEKLKGVLTLIGLIGLGILAWKIADSIPRIKDLADAFKMIGYFKGDIEELRGSAHYIGDNASKLATKMQTIGGYVAIVAGLMLAVKGYSDAWANGVDWGNLALMISGAAVACAGLYLAFGKLAMSIGIITAGVALMVIGVKDFIDNGPTVQNTILIIGGAIAVAVGLATAGLSVLLSAIIAAVAAVAAFTAAILLEKPAIMSVEEAQKNLTAAKEAAAEAENGYINAVDAAEAAMNRLKEAEEAAGVTGEELYKQVQSGTLDYANMTDAQKEVYKAYLDNEQKQKDLEASTKALNDAKKAETIASYENQLALAKESGNYEEFKKSVVAAFEAGELSADEARELIGKSMSEMGDDAQKTFMEDLPGSITKGLDPSKYETTGKKMKDWFKKAWKDIKGFFSDAGEWFAGVGKKVGEALSGAFKKVINWVLEKIESTVNAPFKMINKGIDILNKVPGIEITKLGLISIPRLATGGIVTSSTIANIGEAGREAVLPLENNTGWMDTLADRIASRNNTPSRIVLMLDGRELGWASINSINGITKQTGNLQLALG